MMDHDPIAKQLSSNPRIIRQSRVWVSYRDHALNTTPSSYGQLGIAPPTRQNLQPTLDIRSNHGDVTRKLADRDKEVTEQNE